MKNKGTIALVSLGCAKNAADLEVMAGDLLKSGFTLSPDPDRADRVIVNTCSFIADAREESEAEIRRALELKRRGRYGSVTVTGCYPQRYPEAIAAFPGVDEWLGVPGEWTEPRMPAFRLTGKAYAYLKIAEGCRHRCAYCAIPSIRGKYRSRPLKSILREAKALLASGCRELNVIAQDPMLWRDGDLTLVDLLRALDRLEGKFWIRVLYSYPSEITEDFIAWLVDSPHAVRYLDIPLQHTSPEVLSRMNRARTAQAVAVAAETLRDVVPGITLRTTVMTGFPGETPKRFNRMLADLKRMQFDRLGAFAYSPEKGTKAYSMPHRPSRRTAEERMRLVMEQQSRIWKHKSKRMLGEVHEALVIAPGAARLAGQAPDVDGVVFVDDDRVGEFIDVRLDAADGFDFEGTAV